jgi:hypothetical protein
MAEAAREDEAFVAELLAILTKPDPTGIDPYGMADDGINRWNGLGRDIWVESLRVVDGEYGPELEVVVRLAVPADETPRIPGRAVARVPFEREWRRLSGYESPADYAPYVAGEAEWAARSHIRVHRAGPSQSTRREAAPLPARDVQWQLLLDGLAVEGGPAVEVSPGRIEVRLADSDDHVEADSPVVTVVVTPGQWEDVLAAHGWRHVEIYLAQLLGPRDPDERFVVYYRGELVRSIREELPPVRGAARARRFAAMGPGGWYAVAPQPSPEPDPRREEETRGDRP